MKTATHCVELEPNAPGWMIRLARAARIAEQISIQNFHPGTAELGFVRTICTEQNFLIKHWDDDLLVLERG